jgi:hypothetical protein
MDGYEAFEDGIEGRDQQTGGSGVIKGRVVKFTNDSTWILADDEEEVAPDLELVAVDIGRVVQRWRDQSPIETIILAPGQRYPNVNEMNEAVPKAEWVEGPSGEKRGPWQAQHIVYLLDPLTMDRFSYPTGTIGGQIAVRDLVDRTKWMRRFRGSNVFPVITLSDTFMKTRFGGRQRPHFLIKRWIALGDGDRALPAPDPSTTPRSAQAQLEHFAGTPETVAPPSAPATPESPLPGARTVVPPTLAEETGDEIPF